MDVIIMLSITSLAAKLQADFPDLQFTAAEEFRWLPVENTVFYDTSSADLSSLLHELSHAVLRHSTYRRDIELLKLERDAWHHAQRLLALTYDISISEEYVQTSLDTYRDWLHARSTCPECQATGIQTKQNEYKCFTCASKWHVNDARGCALRRYKVHIKQKHTP